jgi:hypothetical protein
MIKLTDLLTEEMSPDIDKRQYLADVHLATQAIKNLKDAFMTLEAGNYHPDKVHAQQVLQSMRERADLLANTFKKAYLNKYYNK